MILQLYRCIVMYNRHGLHSVTTYFSVEWFITDIYLEHDISNALYSVTDFLYCLQWHKIGEHTVTSIYNQRYDHDWNKPLYKTEQYFTKHIVTFCERYLRILKLLFLLHLWWKITFCFWSRFLLYSPPVRILRYTKRCCYFYLLKIW